jgi:hypothetical protein
MTKNQLPVQKISKKEAEKLVFSKLANALAEYKKDVKAKKFKTTLKKASKLFAEDIAKASHKNNGKLKQTQKKKTKTKVEEKHEVAS